MVGLNEFIDCGPRVVKEDDIGYYVYYREKVYSSELESYLGEKVHVVADLTGSGWSISEWCDPTRLHPGGWRTRAGTIIELYIETWQNDQRKGK